MNPERNSYIYGQTIFNKSAKTIQGEGKIVFLTNGAGKTGYAKLLQLCLILCDPMDCSPAGSSVHGILRARRLE